MLELIFSRPGPGGTLDPAWMRQLSDLELDSAVPMTAGQARARVYDRDPTPLLDQLPPFWRQRVTPPDR